MEQENDLQIHRSPWAEWFATQESTTGVFICNRASAERMLIEPPREWGRHWAWNLTEDGSGIYLRHTR